MSLQYYQLPPIVICNLYKDSLVDLHVEIDKAAEEDSKIKFVGGNNKHILLLADNADSAFLTGNEFDFLSGILSACSLNLGDVAIVNLNTINAEDYKIIPEYMQAAVIILFGIESHVLGLPFKIPYFQVQQFKGRTYLFAPRLDVLKNDTDLKRKLWEGLKNIFSL